MLIILIFFCWFHSHIPRNCSHFRLLSWRGSVLKRMSSYGWFWYWAFQFCKVDICFNCIQHNPLCQNTCDIMRSLSKMLVTGYLLNNKNSYVLASCITGHSVPSLNSKNKTQEYKKNQEHKVGLFSFLQAKNSSRYLTSGRSTPKMQNETPLGNLEI